MIINNQNIEIIPSGQVLTSRELQVLETLGETLWTHQYPIQPINEPICINPVEIQEGLYL